MSESPEILVLQSPSDPDPSEDPTYERQVDRRLLWLLVGLAATVIVVAAAGAIVGAARDDTAAPPATTAAARASDADPDVNDDAAADVGTSDVPSAPRTTGLDALAQEFNDQVQGPAAALPQSVTPFDAPDDLVLVGLSPSNRLAAVSPSGQVQELLPNAGGRFFPLAASSAALLGSLNAGAGTFSITTDGSVFGIPADTRDAPIYLPSHDGEGFVVHGTWLGQIDYIDASGQTVGEGPELTRGTRVIGDAEPGLVIEALDGTALLIDRTTGEVIRRLAAVPLAVGGNHQVVLACDDGDSCRAEIQLLSGETTAVLDIDPVLADRLVVGMSPDGRQATYLFQQRVRVVDTAGTQLASIAIGNLVSVGWLDGSVVVAHDQGIEIWNPGAAEPTSLDLGAVIDPGLRGLFVLRG